MTASRAAKRPKDYACNAWAGTSLACHRRLEIATQVVENVLLALLNLQANRFGLLRKQHLILRVYHHSTNSTIPRFWEGPARLIRFEPHDIR